MKKSKIKKKPSSKRVPYSKASDDKKVERNWNKTRRLFNRGEYSVSVIRCGTCVELAVNFAVRHELVDKRDLPLPFVNNLLKSANGLSNKYQNIFLPIMAEYKKYASLRKLWKDKIEKINKDRNAVVHSGEFRSKSVARKVMQTTYEVLQEIMNLYEHKARFKDVET